MMNGVELEKMERSDHDVLIRLETKMDSLTSEVGKNNTSISTMIADHETRLRVLEKEREKRSGDTTGSLRARHTIITILSLLVAFAGLYVAYVAGNKQ